MIHIHTADVCAVRSSLPGSTFTNPCTQSSLSYRLQGPSPSPTTDPLALDVSCSGHSSSLGLTCCAACCGWTLSIHLIRLSLVLVSKASMSPDAVSGTTRSFLQVHLLWVGAGRRLPAAGGRGPLGLLCWGRFCRAVFLPCQGHSALLVLGCSWPLGWRGTELSDPRSSSPSFKDKIPPWLFRARDFCVGRGFI